MGGLIVSINKREYNSNKIVCLTVFVVLKFNRTLLLKV